MLTFRYANALEPVDRDGYDYWDKGGGLCVRDYAGLAQLKLQFDQNRLTLDIRGPGGFAVAGDLSEAGRRKLSAAVAEFVRETAEGKRLARAGRLPLHLIGDGVRARFQDRARGYVTLHNRASLRQLEAAVEVELDEVRFRSNIAVDGWEPWQEDELLGQRIRVGGVLFEVAGPIVRCRATHANPQTGAYDVPVLQTLTRVLERPQPSFGLLLLPVEFGAGQSEIALSEQIEIR